MQNSIEYYASRKIRIRSFVMNTECPKNEQFSTLCFTWFFVALPFQLKYSWIHHTAVVFSLEKKPCTYSNSDSVHCTYNSGMIVVTSQGQIYRMNHKVRQSWQNECLPCCGVGASDEVGVLPSPGIGEFGGVVGLLTELVFDLLEEKRAKSPRLTGAGETWSFFSSPCSITEKHNKSFTTKSSDVLSGKLDLLRYYCKNKTIFRCNIIRFCNTWNWCVA